MLSRLKKNEGTALLVAIMVMLMLTLIFVAAITTSVTDIDIAKNQKERTSAFYVAEAGLQLGMGVLRLNPDQLDNDTLESLINATPSLGGGGFMVDVVGTSPYKTLTSEGLSQDGDVVVQVVVKRRKIPLSIWDNIIFAGEGQNGKLINGNVNMHGSIHILGDSLASTDTAMEISGNAHQFNNYEGMNAALSSRVPPLDTTTFNGEVVETLDAELRVKNGRVNISGSASTGFPDVAGGSPQVKETLDGCYVPDGFGGDLAESGVYSDNGTTEDYDLGDDLNMPDLNASYTDPNTGITYPTYMNYLQNNALVISGDLTLEPGESVAPVSDGFGSISLDVSGNLQITGIVYVTGNITIKSGKGQMNHAPIIFDGRGTLVSEVNISINTHVLSQGTFPTDDVLGFISADDIDIGCGPGDAHLDVMGAFFAQDQITNEKQNQLAGAMVSDYFDLFNVPDVFHIPSIAENLPPGMPGGGTVISYTYKVVKGTWREL
jgi:hypothetical protein